MAKVVQFPDSTKAWEGAAEWLARLDRGLSDEDREQLQQWVDADPANRRALLELASLWDELDMLAELSALFPLEQPVAQSPRRVAAWSVAASVALCAIAVGFIGYQALVAERDGPAVASQAADFVFRTMVGEQAAQPLPDGSVVTLNTNTEIDVEYSSAGRDVFLRRGEGHFDVAHDPARPFNVHVAGRVVQAVGTAFNVRLEEDGGLQVTVTEGEIRLSRPLQATAEGPPRISAEHTPDAFEATLAAGDLAILDRAAHLPDVKPSIVRLARVAIDNKLAWQRGELIFDADPLESVLDEVGRYTTTEFRLEGAAAAMAGQRVSGVFQTGEVDAALLNFLHENFGLTARRVAYNRVVLRPAD